tara:strand:- start:36552 stop:36770 length:219 start_codon:yes stop_codon:yes gene_type:complete
MNAFNEAGKDTSRVAIFGALSTLLSYAVNSVFPNMPGEVQSAVLVLIFAGLVYVDSYIHNRKDMKANGLVPW